MEKLGNMTATNVNQTTVATVTLDSVVNRVVVPLELMVGFVCQVINLTVLCNHKIRGETYSFYLKALSVNYIISIVMLLLSILRKNGMLDMSSCVIALYVIHFEQYLANLFLFSGNLLIIAMAGDGLKAITCPLQRLNLNERGSYLVTASIYIAVAILLLPVTVMNKMGFEIIDNTTKVYKGLPVDTLFIRLIRYVVVTTFEVILILLILVIYTTVLIKYHLIVRQHFCSVKSLMQTSSRTMNAYHHKATVICLASVTAFLVCNLPSALMEMCYLSFYLRGTIETFIHSQARLYLRSISNSLLAFNFTLTFMLQYAVSLQYRKKLHCIFEKGKRNISDLLLLRSYRQADQNDFFFYGNKYGRNYV